MEVFSRKYLKMFLSGSYSSSGSRALACAADTVEGLLAFVFSKEQIQSRSTDDLSRGLFRKAAEVYLSKKPKFNKAKRSKHSRERLEWVASRRELHARFCTVELKVVLMKLLR